MTGLVVVIKLIDICGFRTSVFNISSQGVCIILNYIILLTRSLSMSYSHNNRSPI